MAGPIIIEIQGLDALMKRLGDKSLVTEALAKALDKSVLTLQARAAHYPPRPPASTYRRKGTLGREITTKVDRAKLVGRVGTKLGYAPYVIGDERQARWMGHWHTMGSVVEEKLPAIKGYFAAAGREITVKLAGG